ncbi:hypothetical protein C8R44DRAFT_980593 [Mycena epipterygia]|nr:hypothetical protein C8R44DRAFT_980593 [Mycena epipterygia]
MIDPPPSFYNPNDPWDHPQQQFNFSYPAPGTSSKDLLPVQFYPQQQQQQLDYALCDTEPNPNTTHAQPPASTPKCKRVAALATYSDTVGMNPRVSGARLPGACTHCKKLKMKCDFEPVKAGTENTCRRCRSVGHECIVEGRRPRRSLNNKGEYFLAQIRQKDSIIESLLKQDIANPAYFKPGPVTDLVMRAQLIEPQGPPEILIHGVVIPEDVDKLFEIYFARVKPFVGLLDPVLHTPASTFARCPFLFTVVCAISSRYYPEKSEIYPIAMHFAKHAAATALIDGWKSVELCQAYILMSMYTAPTRKWEEDPSWLYAGLAIRLAMDLNLHQVISIQARNGSEEQERERLNCTRVWITCFNLDRGTATQFGKPLTIKEDYILRHGNDDWYKKSPYNSMYDVHMCCYMELVRLGARFHDDISDPISLPGLNKRVDLRTVTLTHDANFARFHEEWNKRFGEYSDPNNPTAVLRAKMLPFLISYLRLVMFSFPFQEAYERGLQAPDHIFFTKCMDSAKGVLLGIVEGLAPTGLLRYAPDGFFIISAYAYAFLLKLLRPEFSHLLDNEQENAVFNLLGQLVETLSSPEIAIHEHHTPKLYARFLARLFPRYHQRCMTVGRLRTPGSSSSDYKHQSGSGSTFSMQPMPGEGASLGPEHAHGCAQWDEVATPIFRPEARFVGQIPYSEEMDMGAGVEDEEKMLAAMQPINNPAWWDNMMMPGFSWPSSRNRALQS